MTDIDVTTYCDDASLGKPAPSIASLEPIKGEAPKFDNSKVYVLYFFNTFYRGADVCNEEFTKLSEKLAGKAEFIAISNDADRAKTEKYLGKTIVDENTKQPLRLDPPHILYDNNKAVAKEYVAVSNLSVMSCPMAFIVAKGNIVWRQQFLQTHIISQSNFEAQLDAVLNGKELAMNGPRPTKVVEEEEAEIGEEFSLF
eukprot:gene287-160_t